MSGVKCDVIVIGAGVSGLYAAKLLAKQGVEVLVLEARDRVGGRLYTIQDKVGGYVDVGGAYVGPTQHRVMRLTHELGLSLYRVNTREKSILNLQGTWAAVHGTIPTFRNPLVNADLNRILNLIDDMAATIPLGAPWQAPDAQKWDSMTFQEFIDKVCWTSTVKSFLAITCKTVLCVEPWEVSLLFVINDIASGQGIKQTLSVENGAQELKIVGGAMQLATGMAKLMKDRVLLGKPVVRVEQDKSGASVYCANGEIYKADYVISALPPALLNRINFLPSLPPLRLQLIQRIPMGSIIKTMMYYERPFWRDRGFCGEMTCDHGPVLYCVDDSKPDGSSPCIMGFVLANQARELVRLSPEERKTAIMKHYAKVFRDDEFLKPIHYLEKNWMEDEYSGGCYCAAMPPGVLTSFGRAMKAPHGRVLFAGAEIASYWSGYMEGALETGELAAQSLLEKMGRQQAPDGKNLVHPLLVMPSSAESTLETTEKRTTMTGASVGALCATALGAAAIWKLKSAL